LAEKENYHN